MIFNQDEYYYFVFDSKTDNKKMFELMLKEGIINTTTYMHQRYVENDRKGYIRTVGKLYLGYDNHIRPTICRVYKDFEDDGKIQHIIHMKDLDLNQYAPEELFIL